MTPKYNIGDCVARCYGNEILWIGKITKIYTCNGDDELTYYFREFFPYEHERYCFNEFAWPQSFVEEECVPFPSEVFAKMEKAYYTMVKQIDEILDAEIGK